MIMMTRMIMLQQQQQPLLLLMMMAIIETMAIAILEIIEVVIISRLVMPGAAGAKGTLRSRPLLAGKPRRERAFVSDEENS